MNLKHNDTSSRYYRVEMMINEGNFEDQDHKNMFIDRMYACDEETFDDIFTNHLETRSEIN